MKDNLTFYYRPKGRGVSIEKIFDYLNDELSSEFNIKKAQMGSRYGRFVESLLLCKHQSTLNHITGDIHFLAIFLRKGKTVITIHDLNYYHKLKGLKKIIYGFFWFQLPLLFVKKITTISNYTKQDLMQTFGIRDEKIKVIPNPVRNIFKYFPKDFNSARPRILQIGNGDNKNLPRLIEAVKGIDCELVLVRKVDEDIKELLIRNEIKFDWCSDVSDENLVKIYESIDILFFASTAEGFGVPIIEGNAVGRIVITSNTTSMPEVAGDAAIIVNPFDINEIRDAILNVINNEPLREDLIRKGLENSLRFEGKYIARQYFELYNNVINY